MKLNGNWYYIIHIIIHANLTFVISQSDLLISNKKERYFLSTGEMKKETKN
jgi:hypothetical protein